MFKRENTNSYVFLTTYKWSGGATLVVPNSIRCPKAIVNSKPRNRLSKGYAKLEAVTKHTGSAR